MHVRSFSLTLQLVANLAALLLGSSATRHIIPVFTEIVEGRYTGFGVTETQLLADDSCVPCFRRLEAVKKMSL